MEKQKVFWVVLAVSVFVVVVLIVGVLLLRQHPASAPRATVTPMNDSGTQVYEYQREAPLSAPGTGAPAGTTPGGDQQTMHFYIGEGAPGASGTPGTTGATTGAPGASGTSPTPPAGSAPSPSPAAVTQAPPATVTAPARPAAPRTTKPSVSSAPRKSPDYWIQTGSYKSQTKAEELVSLLETKGLTSRVFSYTAKGDTWYRVRVGPYSNRGEATKFLALVKQVQGLEASFIAMVPAGKTAVN